MVIIMSSWAGGRGFAPQKKEQEAISYLQVTQGGFCSNFMLLFSAYINASKNASPLYVHDSPNSIDQTFPLLQSILKENSTIKYLKEISSKSTPLNFNQINNNQFLHSTNIQTLKKIARDLFSLNGDAQEKVMTNIRSAGLERTLFDVGVHIRSGDKITTGEMKEISLTNYANALKTFANRLGKAKLSVFVMTDNIEKYEGLKSMFPTWTFVTLQIPSLYTRDGHNQDTFNALPTKLKETLFYQFLTELHILQNLPNLVLTYSSNIGRYLYLTSRFNHSSDTVISLDVPSWSLF